MKPLAPITLFVYNRLYHTQKTVESLRKNKFANESDLFIFSDGKKDNDTSNDIPKLREYLKTITGFKSVTIIEKEKNMGLANSIISGVTEIVNKYGKVIVVEDDLVTSPYFLSYMNQGLDMYETEEKVISIHGYVYPTKKTLPETFFIRGADCWGWATWKRGWDLFEPNGQKLLDEITEKKLEKEFDMDYSYKYTKMLRGQIEGRNNSWAVRWYASAFLKDKLTLYPGISLVQNIGFDESGTHSTGDGEGFKVKLLNHDIILKPVAIEESKLGRNAFIQYFKENFQHQPRSLFVKIKDKLKKNESLRKLVIKLRVLIKYHTSSKKDPLSNKMPWIVKEATQWLETYLKKHMSVFEWGSGGSTLFMAEKVKEIISIEHNYEWYLKTKLYLQKNNISNCQYNFIGAEKSESPSKYKSTDKNYLRHNFEKYCKAIDSYPDNHFDLVFIDGRARPSCIMHAKNKVEIGGYILLDNSERDEYQSGISTLNDFERTDFSANGSTTSIFKKI